MAKIVLTFEDKPGDKVSVDAKPKFSELVQIEISGAGLTSAQAYALFALNKIREESKKRDKMKLILPRIIKP